MIISSNHTFHIPVMGLAYTIDTPLKVARFNISSVVSIIEDNLLEEMRKYYCRKENENYVPIERDEFDFRAKRITEYLNLLNRIVKRQIDRLKEEPFEEGSEIVKYFELLPSSSSDKILYDQMQRANEGREKYFLQQILRNKITAGSIDVNIMTKCDKTNYSKTDDPLPAEFSDAMSALRGFAKSDLSSSVVFSAGLNPHLFSYCESFDDFFPVPDGFLKKKIILKVSDYRSASIQGKFFAKKGLWVSEFRIESGLNCGGHAFATDGHLLGPILEEFKLKREELKNELLSMCNQALDQKRVSSFLHKPDQRITVQGGIGTSNENNFLMEYYHVDGTGWGSPFLLVPEVTNVDDETLQKLISANHDDYYLSDSSPLGVLYNNFRKSSANSERIKRIEKGNPGSPCYNKFLSFNSEFTEKPICTASREYQDLKINQLKNQHSPADVLMKEIEVVTEKECICQGLGTSVFLKNKIDPPHSLNAVSICPGPNLAYFSGVFSLQDMVSHIYGRKYILNNLNRQNMFINELKLYLTYFENQNIKSISSLNSKQNKYLTSFKNNLLAGIDYYKSLIHSKIRETKQYHQNFIDTLNKLEQHLRNIQINEVTILN